MVNTQRPSRGTGVWRWRRRDPAAARPRARAPRGAGARRALRHRPEDPPRAAAARTDQDLDREHAVQEPGPRPQSWRARAGVHARVVRCGRDDRRSPAGARGPAGRGTPATAGVAGAQGWRAAPTAPAGPPGAPSSRRARKDQRHLRRSTRPGPARLTPAPPPGGPPSGGLTIAGSARAILGQRGDRNRPSDRELSEATRTSG
jgi:hypothetical protein